MMNFEPISKKVTSIFDQSKIVSSFVTGSAVTGGPLDSDIDIFVCYEDDIPPRIRNDFVNYYFDLHRIHNRTPDSISPGEVMSQNDLQFGLETVYDMQPARVVENPREFDAICWAGMMVSKKALLTPETIKAQAFEEFSRDIISKWVHGLFGNIDYTSNTGLDSDGDKILARSIGCPGYYEPHV